MNKKRIIFTPAETVTFSRKIVNEVEEDGEVKQEISYEDVDFTFNNYALMLLTNEFGDINKLQKEYEKRPYDLMAIFLYCGVKPNRTDFTIDEAREIVAGGGPVILDEVSNQVTKYFVMESGEEGKKLFLKEMERQGMLDLGKAMLKRSR